MDSPRERAASEKPRVVAIVLTWNGRELTMDCLASLTRVTYPSFDIIVVDNGSTDGTLDAIATTYSDKVKTIANERNLGFAAGNNVGIEAALHTGADYVLLLNNDTVVDADLIDELVRFMDDHQEAGIIGPKIYYHDQPDLIWFAGGEVCTWKGTARHIGIRERDTGQYDKPREIDYVTGCAMMIRRDVIEKVGVLDTSYRAYFEDTDFCFRTRKEGYKIYYVPTARVRHKISRSTGGQVSGRKIRTKFVSSVRFFLRYAKPYQWPSAAVFFLVDALRIAILIVKGTIRNPPGAKPQ